MNKPKILLFDIETMAGLGWFWEQYETNILSVKKSWYIISFAYKWLGEKDTFVYALPDFPGYKNNKSDDKALCKKLWELLNSADVVIAHYGDAFDLKKANARFIQHGFEPVRPLVSIDTKKVASKHFKFGSNKLNALANYFGVGQKEVTSGWQLWLDCAEHDKKEAWYKMKKYNKMDVILLEKVYYKLRPWIQKHPNLSVINNSRGTCPNCGGKNLIKKGT
jgi:uncharacterized protein YprB with RNaseH-like and TPR domain